MVESKYHKRVKESLYRFGKENKDKYISTFFGSENPLHIVHPQAKRKRAPPIQYESDVYYIRKNKNKIIFEVLDSELRNTSEIISDMIQCCLCPNTDFLFFIIPVESEEEEDKIINMWDVIKDTLINLGVDERMIPQLGVYFILKEESLSYDKTKRILSKLSSTDKW